MFSLSVRLYFGVHFIELEGFPNPTHLTLICYLAVREDFIFFQTSHCGRRLCRNFHKVAYKMVFLSQIKVLGLDIQ